MITFLILWKSTDKDYKKSASDDVNSSILIFNLNGEHRVVFVIDPAASGYFAFDGLSGIDKAIPKSWMEKITGISDQLPGLEMGRTGQMKNRFWSFTSYPVNTPIFVGNRHPE